MSTHKTYYLTVHDLTGKVIDRISNPVFTICLTRNKFIDCKSCKSYNNVIGCYFLRKDCDCMNITEIARLLLGLRAAGWTEKEINDFVLYIESGEEQYKPTENYGKNK